MSLGSLRGHIASVVYLDMARYSEICRLLELEQGRGVESIAELHGQIRALIERALREVGFSLEQALVRGTGDGAILAFSLPAAADRFASSLHRLADRRHNRLASHVSEYRYFRAGVFTGPILREHGDLAGTAASFAARLESAAGTGEILMDQVSWSLLPPQLRRAYGDREIISGKPHDPPPVARRRQVTDPMPPWEARIATPAGRSGYPRRAGSPQRATGSIYRPVRSVDPTAGTPSRCEHGQSAQPEDPGSRRPSSYRRYRRPSLAGRVFRTASRASFTVRQDECPQADKASGPAEGPPNRKG